MTEWTLLPGYPRALGGTSPFIGSRAKYVGGKSTQKNGKTVIISGLAALAQRFEQAMIEARVAGAKDVEAALEATLDGRETSYARMRDLIEEIAFVRYSGTRVDLALSSPRSRAQADGGRGAREGARADRAPLAPGPRRAGRAG